MGERGVGRRHRVRQREKEKEKRPQIGGGGPPDNVARGSTAAAVRAAVPLVADLN